MSEFRFGSLHMRFPPPTRDEGTSNPVSPRVDSPNTTQPSAYEKVLGNSFPRGWPKAE